MRGLKIAKARGKYYVYVRSTGTKLISGFEGDKAALLKELEKPSTFQAYNRPRLAKRSAESLGIETLGGFINWFTNGDIDRAKEQRSDPNRFGDNPNGFPKWREKLAPATRKDYLEAFDYLRPEFDLCLKDITQPDLYDARDKCANEKWPRFADQMISALSSMFKQAVKRGKRTGMLLNPCLGMDKAHTADKNANREWFEPEWVFVRENAPMEVLIACMLARYAGLRGQTIVEVHRKMFIPHPQTGEAVRYRARKNNKWVTLPVLPELQRFMASLKIERADGLIAHRDNGEAWENEVEMQTRVSHWFRASERDGHIGSGTTLHGLRVSYASWWKRIGGANNREIADLLGDESEAMGAHYTRHVEAEINIDRAFERIRDRP